MNYYIDTEFLEGKQDKKILGFKYGETKPTIDLISIGIISDDNREYYAISKDFNLYEAWNSYEEKSMTNLKGDSDTNKMRVYWIRENVLLPIYYELCLKENKNMFFEYGNFNNFLGDIKRVGNYKLVYKNFKKLINKYGKTNKEIAEEIERFIRRSNHVNCNTNKLEDDTTKENVKFYGYYSAYDHVVLCQLFEKMIDLPKGFPMYTIDLKQELDRIAESKSFRVVENINKFKKVNGKENLEICLSVIKSRKEYPKQINNHHALEDAKWNKELHNFLKTI